MKKTNKSHISRYIQLFIVLFLSAFCFNLFLLPTHIVAGGVNGIAIITEHVFNFDPSVVIFIISVFCLLLSFIFLGKDNSLSAIISTIFYPLFVKLSLPLANMIIIDTSDLFLISILVGLVSGLTTGLIYKNGFNNGNLGIISQILYKYFRLSVSKSNFILNTLVVILGGFYFGWTKVMYAIIIIFINSVVMEKVLLGISTKKAFYIITDKSFEIERFIIDELNHSVTIFNAKGGFLFKNKKMLLAVVPTKEYFILTEGIKEIDPKAFFVATDAYQSYGEE